MCKLDFEEGGLGDMIRQWVRIRHSECFGGVGLGDKIKKNEMLDKYGRSS